MANRNAKPVAMLTNQNDSLSINAAAAVHNSNFPVSSASHFYNQSDVTSSTNQKQVAMLGFETQQNVTSMMPYLSVPIRGDSSMIYPTLSPLAAAAAAYYNANYQPRQSSGSLSSNGEPSNAAANLINAALGVGSKLPGRNTMSPQSVAQQPVASTLSLPNADKQTLQGDLSALSCGMHVPDVGSLNNTLIGNYSFAPQTANVGMIPNASMDSAWATAAAAAATYHPYGTISAYSMEIGGARRKNATRETTSTLKAWLHEHIKNPYPTKGEKIMLAIITKMTLTQVSTWFANARRRLKKENKMVWLPRNRCDNDQTSSAGSSEMFEKVQSPLCNASNAASENGGANALLENESLPAASSTHQLLGDRIGKSRLNYATASADTIHHGHFASKQLAESYEKIWSVPHTVKINDEIANGNSCCKTAERSEEKHRTNPASVLRSNQEEFPVSVDSARMLSLVTKSLTLDAPTYVNLQTAVNLDFLKNANYGLVTSNAAFVSQANSFSKWHPE